jgi:hypothetical protein
MWGEDEEKRIAVSVEILIFHFVPTTQITLAAARPQF